MVLLMLPQMMQKRDLVLQELSHATSPLWLLCLCSSLYTTATQHDHQPSSEPFPNSAMETCLTARHSLFIVA